MNFLDGHGFGNLYCSMQQDFCPDGGKMWTSYSTCCRIISCCSISSLAASWLCLCARFDYFYCRLVDSCSSPVAAVSPGLQHLGFALCQIWPHPPSPGLLCGLYDVQLLWPQQHHHHVPALNVNQDVQLLLTTLCTETTTTPCVSPTDLRF